MVPPTAVFIGLLAMLVARVYATPATIDTSLTYRLTNDYSGPSKSFAALADGSGTVEMANTTSSPLQYWTFVLLETGPQYALRNVQYGDGYSLDVYNTEGVNSTTVYLATTGTSSGQYWTLTPWGDGTYELTNNFTGMNESLDVYSDTLQPTLDPPDYSGEHWTFTSVNLTAIISSSAISGSSTASASVASTSGIATGSGSSRTFFSTATQSMNASSSTPPTSTGHSGLSTGAIIGIAATLGGVVILVTIGLLVYFKLKFKQNQAAGVVVEEVPDQGTTTEIPMNMIPKEASLGVGVDTNDGISGRLGSDSVEISSGRLNRN